MSRFPQLLLLIPAMLLVSCAHEAIDTLPLDEQVRVEMEDGQSADPLALPSDSELSKAETELAEENPLARNSSDKEEAEEVAAATSSETTETRPVASGETYAQNAYAPEALQASDAVVDAEAPVAEPQSAYQPEATVTEEMKEEAPVAHSVAPMEVAAPVAEVRHAVPERSVASVTAPRVVPGRKMISEEHEVVTQPSHRMSSAIEPEVARANDSAEETVVATSETSIETAVPTVEQFQPKMDNRAEVKKAGAEIAGFVQANPLVVACAVIVAFLTLAFVVNRRRGRDFDF